MSELEEPRKPRKPHPVLWGTLALVVVVAFIVTGNILSAPKRGIIYSVTQNTQQEADATTTKQIQGHNIRFSYPSLYQINRQTTASDASNTIDSYYLTGRGALAGQHLGVGSEHVRAQSLDEFGGVVSRRNQGADFTEEKRTINGAPALVFHGLAGDHELTLFVLKNDLVTTVALSGAAGDNTEALAEFESIVKSLVWLR